MESLGHTTPVAASSPAAAGAKGRLSHAATLGLVAVVAGFVGSVLSGSHPAAWARERLSFVPGLSSRYVYSGADLNLLAHHVRIGATDGDFELEHGAGKSASAITAYAIGSPLRTPITIGGADQDVTDLIVAGRSGQANDLQQWTFSGVPVAAIDGRGRLRLRDVSLQVVDSGGVTRLVARFWNGKERVLARSR